MLYGFSSKIKKGEQKMKKTMFVLLAILLVLAIVPATGLAATTTVIAGEDLNVAITAAADGDTITVANGTYMLDQTTINKNLTITGESEAGVILKPSAHLTVPSYKNPGSGWIEVGTAGSLTISNLTMDGAGKKAALALKTAGELVVSNVTIKNIEYQIYNGIGIGVYQDATLPDEASLTATNVTMSNIERIGIHAKGNTTVDGFTYTGKGAIDCLDYAMEVGSLTHTTYFAVSVTNATITECLGVASSDGSGSAGLYANTYFYSLNNGAVPLAPPIDVTFDNISFNNCSVGVYVGYSDSFFDFSKVVVTNSSISGCKYDFVFKSKQPSGSLTVVVADGDPPPTASLGENNVIVGLDGNPITTADNTEVTAGIDPTFTIVIPASVDFGTLFSNTGIQTLAFPVEARDVVIEPGYGIKVVADTIAAMRNEDGNGSVLLPYTLKNEAAAAITDGGTVRIFTVDDVDDGTVEVDTDNDIAAAGSYKGRIDFVISYE